MASSVKKILMSPGKQSNKVLNNLHKSPLKGKKLSREDGLKSNSIRRPQHPQRARVPLGPLPPSSQIMPDPTSTPAAPRDKEETQQSFLSSIEGDFDRKPAHSSDDELIPDVNERLAYLRPSRELLEFYRKKIAEYDNEHENVVKKLDQYKASYEEHHKLEWEMRQREEEIAELQKALSDIQVYLFQEREQVLRLYAENDRLKIRELESRKRIQQLLALTGDGVGGGDADEESYFFRLPPSQPVVEDRTRGPRAVGRRAGGEPQPTPGTGRHPAEDGEKGKRRKPQHGKSASARGATAASGETTDVTSLALQIEALQCQLEEQARWSKEHVSALLEDRRIRAEEREVQRERDDDKIKILAQKLHKTQDLLYMSTQDFLNLRYAGRENERSWMAEKDKLLRDLDVCKDRLEAEGEKEEAGEGRRIFLNISNGSTDHSERYKQEVKRLHDELSQAHKMCEHYREQLIELEDEVARLREKEDVKQDALQGKTDKMGKRLEIMKARYEELEKRRNLEVAGFQTDIRSLRRRLKDMERQLYKVTMSMGEQGDLTSGASIDVRPQDIDMAVLRNVKRTASRSKKLNDELRGLKAKVYGLQSDMRHL